MSNCLWYSQFIIRMCLPGAFIDELAQVKNERVSKRQSINITVP